MMSLSPDDLTKIQAEIAGLRGDNEVQIEIRRFTSILPAQTVRIERRRVPSRSIASPGGEEVRGQVIVLGAVDLDIEKDDRFTHNDVLYRVLFVRPNRQVCTQAEAEVIQ